MNRISILGALVSAVALFGCNRSDVGSPSPASTAIVVRTPIAATPPSSAASDPSLPEASSALSSPASSASAP